ncbi:MAG: cysteine--tRNA ligase [Candidatus Latescibacteria bacterium]|nr:cysteine--tRNA ligase [Candidatus Latescibacterota bacterium]
MLQLYNTLTRRKEAFKPIEEGRVGIYVCGPTVYDHAHLGHAKSYVNFDVIVRYLRYLGYRVRYIQNITDVGHLLDSGEDRVLKGAAREQVEPMELVEKYTRSYFEDMDALNVDRPDISPHASAHIPEQIELIQTLVHKDYAYEVNGSVYYSVEKFLEYGKLSGRRIEELREGTRIESNPEKRHPADFALWKRAQPGHIMRWTSPWGWGYPGWHIECSAMAMKYLGESFDIHGGGVENIFPHHECEIAQSEAATGKPFAKYWLHNGMVMIGDSEMHKSLGNFVSLKDLFKTYPPIALRFFILSSHYRSPLDFSDEAISSAAKGLERLQNALFNIVIASEATEADVAIDENKSLDQEKQLLVEVDTAERKFQQAMDDDFNTALALSQLFDLTKQANVAAQMEPSVSQQTLLKKAKEKIEKIAGVLGLQLETGEMDRSEDRTDELVSLLVKLREELRRDRQWGLADKIRDGLNRLAIAVEDRPGGVVWRWRGSKKKS